VRDLLRLIDLVHFFLKFYPLDEYDYKAANFLLRGRDEQIWATSDYGITLLKPKIFTENLQKLSDLYTQDIEFYNEEVYFTDGTNVFKLKDNVEHEKLLKVKGKTIIQLLPNNDGFWYSDNQAKLYFRKNNGSNKEFDLSKYGKTIFSLTEFKGLWLCQDDNNSIIRIQDGKIKQYGLAMFW